jgi:hypothetical protein
MLTRPAGESLSEVGEYASTVCMENMLSILGEARRGL